MKILNINGFTVLYEKKNTDVVTIRYIVNAGASSEISHEEFGAAHYLEHMFFKGTKYHNYKEINRITSKLGDINAYTAREQTVFHFKTLNRNFEESANILSEMFFHPLMDEEEFNKERTVILEEYQSGIDDPVSFFVNMKEESFWGNGFGHKIIGNKNSILNMDLNTLNSFRSNFYVLDNMAIAVIGNIDEELLIKTFSKILENVPSNHYAKLNSNKIKYEEIDFNEFSFNHKSKQAIISLTTKGVNSCEHKDINFVGSVFSEGLGGGMHSLLFDRIREELGLCYQVGAWVETYKDVGAVNLFSMLDENNIDLAKDEMLKIIENVKDNGFDEELLSISKESLLFNTACTSETSSGYAGLVADTYFLNGFKCLSYEDKVKSLDKVNNDDIKKFAQDFFKLDQIKYVRMTNG